MTEAQGVKLFGFQDGPQGFVHYGLEPEPMDHLFLRASAGRGSGKTFAGAVRATVYMCKYPGSMGMCVGLTVDKIRDTIIPKWWEILSTFGMREGTHFEYNKTEKLLTFLFNGSRCFMRSAEEPENLPGPDLAWFWLDEYRKMPFIVWEKLVPTLRGWKKNGYPHQAWMTSTPAGRAHWSRMLFFPKAYAAEFGGEVYERKVGTYRSYAAYTVQNPHGGQELDALMAGTYGKDSQLYKQEALGQELVLEDLVYSMWDARRHIVPREKWPVKHFKRVSAGVDFGFAVPSAIAVIAIDGEGRYYLLDEFYQKGMSHDGLVAVARRLKAKHGIQEFVCDSADPNWIRAFLRGGLHARKANKTVGTTSDPSCGIGLVYAALARQNPDGTNGFYCAPHCLNFRREIENYVRDEVSDSRDPGERPRKKGDHMMDATKYVMAWLDVVAGSGRNATIGHTRKVTYVA